VALLLLSVVLFLLLGVAFALCFRDSHGPQLGWFIISMLTMCSQS
jgi:hypothetical protein